MTAMLPDPYKRFRLIIDGAYTKEEQNLLEKQADSMFEFLDIAQANNLDNENHSKKVPYDFETQWDFPDPPDFLV